MECVASCRSLYTLTASLTARGMVSFVSVLPHLQPDIPDILVKQVHQHITRPYSVIRGIGPDFMLDDSLSL